MVPLGGPGEDALVFHANVCLMLFDVADGGINLSRTNPEKRGDGRGMPALVKVIDNVKNGDAGPSDLRSPTPINNERLRHEWFLRLFKPAYRTRFRETGKDDWESQDEQGRRPFRFSAVRQSETTRPVMEVRNHTPRPMGKKGALGGDTPFMGLVRCASELPLLEKTACSAGRMRAGAEGR